MEFVTVPAMIATHWGLLGVLRLGSLVEGDLIHPVNFGVFLNPAPFGMVGL